MDNKLTLMVILCLNGMGIVLCDICQSPVCRFTLKVRRKQTMTYRSEENGRVYDVTMNKTIGKLQIAETSYHIQSLDHLVGSFVSHNDVITADGYPRNVIVVNEQFPGPTIEVMEGAQVEVNVVNHLITDGITIHWHGMYQLNNLWMDGPAYVTQCPILPRQSFTYRFIADPAGTHWYHSHNANQRQDGLQGALIVHKHPPTIPYHIINVQDWAHIEAESFQVESPYPRQYPGSGASYIDYRHRHASHDGVELTAVKYTSTIINGRGNENYMDDVLPIHEFHVEHGETYEFHTIHSGAEYVYEISIDSHKLTILASDGFDLQPFVVDSFIVSPGETFKFQITANQSVGKYFLRAETLRYGMGLSPKADGLTFGGKAMLNYDHSEETIKSNSAMCTATDPCIVFNCPFKGYPNYMNKECVTFDDVRASNSEYANYGFNDTDYEEIFLNVGFNVGSSINGIRHESPSAPLFGDFKKHISPCDPQSCTDNCQCTHIRNLPINKTIQLVLFSYRAQSPAPRGHHAMHLHGYSLAVMKMSFPDYNVTSGLVINENKDIRCETGFSCPDASWRRNDTPPLLNLNNPPIKDTVTIPGGGYLVVRFRTNNPGFWLFHCHSETHLMEGMAMIFNIGSGFHPPLPPNFPQCGDFVWDSEDFSNYIDRKPEDNVPPHQQFCSSKLSIKFSFTENDTNSDPTLEILTTSLCIGMLSVVIFFALVTIIRMISKKFKSFELKGEDVDIKGVESKKLHCIHCLLGLRWR